MATTARCARRWTRAGGDAARALFWLLNPDTVVRGGAIAAILGFLGAHPQAGAIGTAIEDEAGASWPYAFRFHSLAGEIESALRIRVVTRWLADRTPTRRMGADAEPVDWVSGASVVVRGAVFAEIGLIDEGYFLYFEETDFFRKVAAAGWERWYVPGAVVQHISGQSTGLTASDAAARRVPAYWFASRRRYLVRNHGRLYAIVADLIAIAGLFGWRARCWMRRRPHGGSPYFLRDFVRHCSLLRRDVQANAQLPRQSGPAAQAYRALTVLLG